MDEHGTKCSTYFSCHSIFRRLVAFIYFFYSFERGVRWVTTTATTKNLPQPWLGWEGEEPRTKSQASMWVAELSHLLSPGVHISRKPRLLLHGMWVPQPPSSHPNFLSERHGG